MKYFVRDGNQEKQIFITTTDCIPDYPFSGIDRYYDRMENYEIYRTFYVEDMKIPLERISRNRAKYFIFCRLKNATQ